MPGLAAKRLRIDADSELAKLMREARATGSPIVIDTGDDEYAVVVKGNGPSISPSRRASASPEEQSTLWEGYDPEAALRNFDEVAGSWSDIDADALIANIYRWREEGSRPADRP